MLDDLKKALAERALNAEMDHYLATGEAAKSRNGYGRKSVVTDTGEIDLGISRRPSPGRRDRCRQPIRWSGSTLIESPSPGSAARDRRRPSRE
ncbi:transposase [Methylosinus sp. LW4]|uniref:transposase n=1 Tax=Methylosinus sp. LW4 TaxID=136993 RepID=UPI0035273206